MTWSKGSFVRIGDPATGEPHVRRRSKAGPAAVQCERPLQGGPPCPSFTRHRYSRPAALTPRATGVRCATRPWQRTSPKKASHAHPTLSAGHVRANAGEGAPRRLSGALTTQLAGEARAPGLLLDLQREMSAARTQTFFGYGCCDRPGDGQAGRLRHDGGALSEQGHVRGRLRHLHLRHGRDRHRS
jgi:hypothetical protein